MSRMSKIIDVLINAYYGGLIVKTEDDGFMFFYFSKNYVDTSTDSNFPLSKNLWGRLWVNEKNGGEDFICRLRDVGVEEQDLINYFLEKYGIVIKDVSFNDYEGYDNPIVCR